MRTLKFRAWHENLEQMFQVTSVSWANGETFEVGLARDGRAFGERDVLACPLMQFTGLKDVNGVEIYEGDILNVCNGSLNFTEWMEKPYAVEYVLNKGFDICMFCWDKDGQSRMNSTHWCEVIGNIYENPELLATPTTVSTMTDSTEADPLNNLEGQDA